MTGIGREAARLPTGTVTFMLTDIEASTAAWESDREAMAAGVRRHYELIEEAVGAHRGVRPVEQGEGDSVVAVFTRATDAVRAACDLQLAMEREPWPGGAAIAVRVALHTGEAQLRDEGNYMGRAVIRAARLRAVGHGGQILCSRATAEVVADDLPGDVTLGDLGSHRLRDLGRPEHVFEVRHPQLRAGFAALKSLDAVPNNLPVHLTSFIGREAELAEVARLFGSNRLTTLTGAGGCGKTRLAAQVAAAVAPNHPDGVWWVELAPLSDAGLVTQTLLEVLGVPDAPGRTAAQRLIAHLAARCALVVLDNCEHVLPGCRDLAETALRGCPGLTLLATSREALGVSGEATWQVPPLRLPAREGSVKAESLGSYDAVRLFLDRAVRARPNFAVTNETAPVVAEICARLDGIPLAIELAAARVRMLSPRQILAGLEDRFRLLTGGSRSGLPHQQTLEASVVWSHDLLTDDERRLLRRLAVFAGGFTLDAAEAVCAGAAPDDGLDELTVFDLLDGLVAKSLVNMHDGDGGEARYGLLETIRQFAMLQLRQAEETAVLRDAHLRYYAAAAERAEAELQTATVAMARRLAVEQDNYRAALDWALAGEDVESALRLVGAFAFLLSGHRGRQREAGQWIDRTLALPGGDPVRRGWAQWTRGLQVWAEGDADGLVALSAEIVAVAEKAGDPKLLARGHQLSTWVNLWVDPAAAARTLELVVPLAEAAQDVWVLMDIPNVGHSMAMRSDDLAAADEWLERAEVAERRWGNDFFRAWNSYQEGGVALRRGDLQRATEATAEAASLIADFGDVSLPGLNDSIAAGTALRRGDVATAMGIVDIALAHCEQTGSVLPLPLLLGVRAEALAVLDDPAVRATFAEALKVAEEIRDYWQHAQVAVAAARHYAGQGELGSAADVLDAARRSGERLGSRWVQAACSGVAGLIASAREDLGKAEDLHHAALALHAAGGYALGVVDELEALAGLAARAESWAEAARLLGATATRRDELGYHHGGAEAALAAARAGLGSEQFEAAFADGAALSIDAAVAYASRARGERKRPSSGWASLTPTELDVVRLAAQGKSNPEIGAALFITAGTAKGHLSNVYAKLGLANLAELAAEATRRGDLEVRPGKRRAPSAPPAEENLP
ncbi:MAG: helix-turn-helix transcriptional regulator [Sporichthyaceae bacterium]